MLDPSPWRVLACKGCGSAIVEAMLATCGVGYAREECNYETPEGRARLLEVNPLAQVPTIVLPDGAIMTESAAIAIYLAETYPAAGLLPSVGDPIRRDALRWLVFIVAAIYPTFTYGDEPTKWAGPELRDSTHAHRKLLWQQVEGEVRGPWFLGTQWSVLDLYVTVMTRWRPNRPWFAASCPKLHTIANALDGDPRFAAVWSTNFD